jgi:fructokinase
VIIVVGEALVDLVVAIDGSVEAALGGAPYNTARAASRLGADVEFVGGLSHDRFGTLLTNGLVDDGVGVGYAPRTDAPTTLALAEIGGDGSAEYRFYLDGTAAPRVDPYDIPTGSVPAPEIFFTGGLGLVLEPMASSVATAIANLDGETLLVVDVNCRPAVVADRRAYVERIEAVVGRADIVKVSDEDLRYLSPDLDLLGAARRVVDLGARSVVVTAGASRTTVLVDDRLEEIAVPPVRGPVIDTIGAGDTFGAGLIAWWSAAGNGRSEVSIDRLAAAVRVGHAAAGVVVTRRGADPPRRSELDLDWP